jgi:hypothetical protein
MHSSATVGGRSRHLATPLKFFPLLRQLFRFAHTRVILAHKQR